MARRKGGRPRKSGERRKNGRLVRSAPARDLGTDEMRRLRQLLNGRLDLPTTPLAALYSRGFLDLASYEAGTLFAALTAISRGGWGFSDGSVQDMWRRLLVGEGGEPIVRLTNGHDPTLADQARSRVAEMREELLREDREGAVLGVVSSVSIDGAWRGC
jgi:hypothetical protein